MKRNEPGEASADSDRRLNESLNRQNSDNSSQPGRRRIHIGSQTMNSQAKFSSNFIKTSKYTSWNFFPLCLLLQFRRYANVYFLIIATLQSISEISPLNPFSAWMPLIFVIGISIAREGYEDYQRYKSDVEMNASQTRVFRLSKFVDCKWGDILVGDLCLVKENETFPADLIVINSSNEGGVCFIETSSLDGEKNYKNKEAMTSTLKWVHPEKPMVVRLMGSVNCIEPNENLGQFEGTISYNGQIVILGAKQFLLRGAKLKNTKWIVGIVVYTGEDTKIMKNADKSKYKVSNIEKDTNFYILFIFCFQLCISVVSAIGNNIWNSYRNPDLVYIPDPSSVAFTGFLTFLTYLVLNNTMIPISLIVSLEVVKLIQGFIIAADEELVQKQEDGSVKLPKVFTTSINEELGQVQYIFSDKTGTLTCNKMELKLMCIGLQLYGDPLALAEQLAPPNESPDHGHHGQSGIRGRKPSMVDDNSEIVFYQKDDTLIKVLAGICDFKLMMPFGVNSFKRKESYSLMSQKDVAIEYFMLLATCHECVLEQKDQSEVDPVNGKNEEKMISQQKSPMRKPLNSNNNINHNSQNNFNINSTANNTPNLTNMVAPMTSGTNQYNNSILGNTSFQMNKNQNNNNNTTIRMEMGIQNLPDPSPIVSAHNITGLQSHLNNNNSSGYNSNQSKYADIKYQGPSPDEVTLVDTAKQYGYVFMGSTSSAMNLEIHGQKTNVELLKLFEFNSDRKRMSVIVRHQGILKMYIKGADNMIKQRLATSVEQPFMNTIQASIDDFSKKGLRTLLLAMKVLDEDEYAELDKRYQAAGNAPNREELFFKIAEDYEKDLFLLGATAVEDKLQDRVPETIRDLLQAKINVWMLTGDKMETAENIAKSCKLIQSQFKVLRYTVKRPPIKEGQVYKTPEALIVNELKRLHMEKEQLLKLKREKALLIEGEDLADVLSSPRYQELLVATVKDCESVVCCRATPKQKAQVVKMVKDRLNKITLAIGDGANDVNMIQEAHIGIGLFGQEGMRAVQASDYALPEFKGLWRLLLVHGRWNYIRISEMILYFFYKNFVFTIPQFFFSFSNGFSGQSIFDDYYITLYNILFTASPLVIRAITEQDMYYKIREKSLVDNTEKLIENAKLLKLYPKAYYVGQQCLIFNKKNFAIWLSQALIHASIIYAVATLAISNSTMTSDGYSPDLWVYSITIYTCVVLVVDVKLALNTKYWTTMLAVAILVTSIGVYFFYVFIANLIESFNVYLTAQAVFTCPNFYLILLFTVIIVISFDVLILYLKEVDYKGFINHLRALLKNRQDLYNSEYIERLQHVDITKDEGRKIPDKLPAEKKYQQYAQ